MPTSMKNTSSTYNAGTNSATTVAESQSNEIKLRVYSVAVHKANKSQRKVVAESQQKFCCV